MNTGLAIEILEELGSSNDPVTLIGRLRDEYDSHGIEVEDATDLDVNIENDARRIHIRYTSKTGDRRGTLSGMVWDRIKEADGACYRRRLRKWVTDGEKNPDNSCSRCGAFLARD